ncbi:hypothetical protein [Qipengyuania gelatinilytica]|nr:hypothetical protein [Qipengyuania gelatinilytica]
MSNDEKDQSRGDGRGDGSISAMSDDDAMGFAKGDDQPLDKNEEFGSFEPHKDADYYENLAREDRKKVAACTDPNLSLYLREVAILHEREARKLRREERKGARLEASRRPWAKFR